MLLLLASCMSCFAVTAQAQHYPDREWDMALPSSQGIHEQKLHEAIQYLKEHAGRDGVDKLVIVRNGYVVWQGKNADSVHGVWSMTKSFTSTVLGLFIDDGKCELDTPAYRYLSVLKDSYKAVTLRHFTTMTSGYRAVGDEPRGEYKHGPSLTPFDPDPEPLFAPGSRFAYWDSAMNQFANVLTRIAGEPLDSLFARRIARPIGMSDQQWRWGDFGMVNGLRVVSGSGNHARLNISALAAARFGHLFLHRGRWKNQQLISEDWIREATSVQVPASLPLAGFVDQGPGTYGYNWWVNGAGPDGQRKWPDAPEDTYAASGYNNNDMFIIPSLNMVIVRLGLDQEDRAITDAVYGRFLGMIGEALKEN